jgi:hypothetical protein
MNLDEIDLKKIGVLYFDMLNGYYHDMLRPVSSEPQPPELDDAVDSSLTILTEHR